MRCQNIHDIVAYLNKVNCFHRFVSTDDGTKKVKGTPKMMKHTLNEEERGLWHREVDSITMRYVLEAYSVY